MGPLDARLFFPVQDGVPESGYQEYGYFNAPLKENLNGKQRGIHRVHGYFHALQSKIMVKPNARLFFQISGGM